MSTCCCHTAQPCLTVFNINATDIIWFLLKKNSGLIRTCAGKKKPHKNLNTGSDVKNIKPQTVFYQSQTHTHTRSCVGITHTHTHSLTVADGCALHTGRTAGTVWENGGRTVAAGKNKNQNRQLNK